VGARVEAASEQHRAAIDAGDTGPRDAFSPEFHAAVELIGRRWTGAILWALSDRPLYFAELTACVPGLSDRLASRRLRELEAVELVERAVHDGAPARVSYALTEKGRSLGPVLARLDDWAREWKLSSYR
jgi:DNA-binding HxlR family transcriptional regulator